jgi:tetratricopeptide (TPR) repeat protein
MRILLTTMIVCLMAVPCWADDWSGKLIRVKEDGVKLGRKSGDGLVRVGAALSQAKTYTVKTDDGTYLEIETGFLFKNEAVLADRVVEMPKQFRKERSADATVAGIWAPNTVVMFTKPNDQISFGDWVDGKQVSYRICPRCSVVNVIRDNGDGWVRIHDSQHEGWVNKGDLIPLSESIAHWDRVLKASPTNMHALSMRGIVLFNQQEYGKAILDYSEVLRLEPKNYVAWVFRGQLYQCSNNIPKAQADFTSAIKIDPKQPEAFDNRGFLWLTQGKHDEAIADYNEALKLDPKYLPALVNRGNAWMQKQDDKKAIADFTEVLKLNPKDFEVMVNLGGCLVNTKKYDEGIKTLTDVIQVYPKNPVAYEFRGNAWAGKKDYDKAIADYTDAIKLEPKYTAAFMNRGNAWAGKKDYDKAIADYTAAIKLDPKIADAFANRAEACFEKKDYQQSFNDWHAFISIKPKDASAYMARGIVQSKLKNYSDASADFKKAMELNPNKLVITEYAKFLASCPDAKFRDGKKAHELGQRAMEKVGKNAADWRVHEVIAMAYAETGVFAQAVKEQQKAISRLKKPKNDLDVDELKPAEAKLKLYQAKKPYRDEP